MIQKKPNKAVNKHKKNKTHHVKKKHEPKNAESSSTSFRTLAPFLILFLSVFLVIIVASWLIKNGNIDSDIFNHKTFLHSFAIGIAAQLIDGALGMAYGVIATSFLLYMGNTPVIATASVHIAKIFTCGVSGLSHWYFGNVDNRILKVLVIFGVIGGVIGAILLTSVDGKAVRPWVAGYLLIMGCYVFSRAIKKTRIRTKPSNQGKTGVLALVGGFLDAIGGGGWGPVVTSTLVGSGHEPRKVIGSVNAAEFFMTIATGFSFIILIGVSKIEAVFGLIAGGLIMAPFSAKLTAKLPAKFLMFFVGILIIALSSYNLYTSLK